MKLEIREMTNFKSETDYNTELKINVNVVEG